jgi:hypothetical protein
MLRKRKAVLGRGRSTSFRDPVEVENSDQIQDLSMEKGGWSIG